MVVAELERANTRAATVERRNVRELTLLLSRRLMPACFRNSCVQRSSLSRLATTGLIGNGSRSTTMGSLSHLSCLLLHSVKHLELQVTSLETEVDRLSQSLDSQKVVTATVESNTRKMVEERAREASTAVCSVHL